MEYIVLISYLFLTFFIRLLPRIIKKYKTGIDTWYHLSSVQSIKKNGYKIPECNDGFILGGKYDYPFIAHLIVALFVNNIIKNERFINPIIDTLYIFTGYIYGMFIINTYSIEIDYFTLKYFLVVIFSITMLKISTGPRVYSFTPRVFGEFFSFVSIITLHIYYITNNSIFLLLSILFIAITLNTSIFASQVLFFVLLLLSFFVLSPIPFLLFLLGVFMAYVISFGHYKYMLKQQLKYTWQYAKYGQYNHPSVKNRNKLSQYKLFINLLSKLKFKEAYKVFNTNLTFFNIFYKNLDVIISIFILAIYGFFDHFVLFVIISIIIIFFITSFRPFLFLGESDRYLEYLVIFSALIIATNISLIYICYFAFIQVIFYLFTLLLYFKSSSPYDKNFLEALRYVKNNIVNKEDYVIHGILGTYINYPLTILSNINSLAIETNHVYDLANDKKLMPQDATYTDDFDYLYAKYGVNLILVNKKLFNQNDKYNFDKFIVFYENNEFIVYKRKTSIDY